MFTSVLSCDNGLIALLSAFSDGFKCDAATSVTIIPSPPILYRFPIFLISLVIFILIALPTHCAYKHKYMLLCIAFSCTNLLNGPPELTEGCHVCIIFFGQLDKTFTVFTRKVYEPVCLRIE